MPVTAADQAQTGISARMLAPERTAAEVMTALDATLAGPGRRLDAVLDTLTTESAVRVIHIPTGLIVASQQNQILPWTR